ncbi:MAG TPA: hypothetical protein VF092_08170 [Longimicrobium sp.]
MLDTTRVARAVFGVAIAAALGFGASQLSASPRAASTCPFNPSAGLVGACSSQANCESQCLAWFPENGGVGHCFQGCCTCAT